MTVNLVIINVVVYLVENLVYLFAPQTAHIVSRYFALSPAGLWHGRIWQLLTFQFLHTGPWPWHVLFNCLALYFFGRSVESALGRKTFTKLYFLSGFFGGILQVVVMSWIVREPAYATVVGASAGVAGVVAAFAMLFPENQITLLLFFIIPVSLKAKYLFWFGALISLYGTIFPFGGVAHAAHLGGIVAGFSYLRWGMHYESLWLSRRPPRPRLRPRQLVKVRSPKDRSWSGLKAGGPEDLPPEEFISREVDPILDKISAHGIQSLTPEERQILEKARARMRKH